MANKSNDKGGQYWEIEEKDGGVVFVDGNEERGLLGEEMDEGEVEGEDFLRDEGDGRKHGEAGRESETHGSGESGENEEVGRNGEEGELTEIIESDGESEQSGGKAGDEGSGEERGLFSSVEKVGESGADKHDAGVARERKEPAEIRDESGVYNESGGRGEEDETPRSDFPAREAGEEGEDAHQTGAEDGRSETYERHKKNNKKSRKEEVDAAGEFLEDFANGADQDGEMSTRSDDDMDEADGF